MSTIDSKKNLSTKSQNSKLGGRQGSLFESGQTISTTSSGGCEIVAVGKRRDGGTRYWCFQHKADATAKYGRPADCCRRSHIPAILSAETLSIDVNEYDGGVALWGAVPPVYDTTLQALDRGIHVHARTTKGGSKDIDTTYRSVRLIGGPGNAEKETVTVSELDAIYYMVSRVFGLEMKCVECTYCGYSHLDKDWFSVHAHRRHLCAGCGKYFRDTQISIGNPVCQLGGTSRRGKKLSRPATAKLDIRQRDFPGGIQIWGSNLAILWTGELDEEEGIHVHAFEGDGAKAVLDDTFAQVMIDGLSLDPSMVRTLMAQSALPHIENRVVDVRCSKCGAAKFDSGEDGFTPKTEHCCAKCGANFPSRGRLRNVIGNPLIGVLERLAKSAPRPPQKHDIGLLPETI